MQVCVIYHIPHSVSLIELHWARLLAGDWRLGLRHGHGVYLWGERLHQYEGEWADDIPHGEGTVVLGDGSAYSVRHGIVFILQD